MAELIYADNAGTLPASYRLPPNLGVTISSVTATFDGTGASGTFLACVAVYSQDGKLISRTFPNQQFAPGDSGEVTFAAFLGDEGKGYIHYGSNEGDRLTILADGDDLTLELANGCLIELATGIAIEAAVGDIGITSDVGNVQVDAAAASRVLLNTDGGAGPAIEVSDLSQRIRLSTRKDGYAFQVRTTGGSSVIEAVDHGGPATDELAFFGATPVVRQPVPVTLANVIALLQAYGLAA